jgi:hypothetical protein
MILNRIEYYEVIADRYERVLQATIAKYERALQGPYKAHKPPGSDSDTISPDIAYKKLSGVRHKLGRLVFVHGCLSKCLRYNDEVRKLNSIDRMCFHDDEQYFGKRRRIDK